jgi:FKBP-type peptidyl-prolyl cis-trans isomerase SlyD
MNVGKDTVVTIDYTLTNPAGEVIDTSNGREPLAYIHGAHHIIPGLEMALFGKTAGDQLDVSVAPEEGYGPRNEELVQAVPRSSFSGVKDIQPGMQFRAQTGDGHERVVTVTAVSEEEVTVDANHPLAGMPLKFAVKIVGVREATADELSHGHVHGAGGHHH